MSQSLENPVRDTEELVSYQISVSPKVDRFLSDLAGEMGVDKGEVLAAALFLFKDAREAKKEGCRVVYLGPDGSITGEILEGLFSL